MGSVYARLRALPFWARVLLYREAARRAGANRSTLSVRFHLSRLMREVTHA